MSKENVTNILNKLAEEAIKEKPIRKQEIILKLSGK